MKKQNLKKTLALKFRVAYCFLVILSILGATIVKMPGEQTVKAQTSSGCATTDPMKKLSPALKDVVNGNLTTTTPWFEATAATPYVQVL